MLKQRIFRAIIGLALLLAVIGSAGIAADELGVIVTSPAHACQNSSGSGGGC